MPTKRQEDSKTYQLSTLVLSTILGAFVVFIFSGLYTSKKPDEHRVQELINHKIELEQTRQAPTNKAVEKFQETLDKVLENQNTTQRAVEKLQEDVKEIKEEQDATKNTNK